jgi:hypothetical protein
VKGRTSKTEQEWCFLSPRCCAPLFYSTPTPPPRHDNAIRHGCFCEALVPTQLSLSASPPVRQSLFEPRQISSSSMDSSHNFAQPSLSPTDFFNGLELTPAIQPGPRSYKSRKYRPCDFCRARQVACKIDITPPCQLCSSHGRQCTFVERPKKKRRPNASNGEGSGSGTSGTSCRDGANINLGDGLYVFVCRSSH